jgi:hypothetical protein
MAFVENEETLDNPMGMVIEEEEVELPEDMIAEENPDGSVSFYQEEVPSEQEIPFDANLAEFLDDTSLGALSAQLLGDIKGDLDSRSEWEETYRKGLDSLGIKYEDFRDFPFEGASSVTHPLLAESVTQFQAQAYKELMPAGGPVRTQIVGTSNPEIEAQADRVAEFMNYQITVEMKEYDPEMDMLLFYLPLSGSAFKKTYYDRVVTRPVSKFVPAEDIIVPYGTTDLESAQRIAQRISMPMNELKKLQFINFYKDVEVLPSDNSTYGSSIRDEEDSLEGVHPSYSDDNLIVYELHAFIDLPDFPHRDENGEETGIALPYIVTIDEGSGEILSIRRNYYPEDPFTKIEYFIHYKFLPGLGFYGFGLPHMIGGLARGATSILRQLIDAGTLANLPGGFKQRGVQLAEEENPIRPGEFRDIDAPAGLREAIMPLPFKEPSQTLLQLLSLLVQDGRRFVSLADQSFSDMNNETPVGTTVALIERGSRVMSAIHKRCHYAQKQEFILLADILGRYLPPEYPYNVGNINRLIKSTDFDGRVDIIPVSDPNIFSMSQRVALAQNILQMVQSNPQIHGEKGVYEAYRRMYEALNVRDVEQLLPPPPQPQPKDPALENNDFTKGMGAQAFEGQNHDAHIKAHMALMVIPIIQANPTIVANVNAHIMQHLGLKAREIVTSTMMEQVVQLMQAQGGMIAPEQQAALANEIEDRIAETVAAMTEGFAQAQEPSQQKDPLVAIREQEVMLAARKLELEGEKFKQKSALDSSKAAAQNMVDVARVEAQNRAISERSAIARERIAANLVGRIGRG